MTPKQKAEARCAELGCTVTRSPVPAMGYSEYLVNFPGTLDGCTQYVCTDWQDVIDRLDGLTPSDFHDAN